MSNSPAHECKLQYIKQTNNIENDERHHNILQLKYGCFFNCVETYIRDTNLWVEVVQMLLLPLPWPLCWLPVWLHPSLPLQLHPSLELHVRLWPKARSPMTRAGRGPTWEGPTWQAHLQQILWAPLNASPSRKLRWHYVHPQICLEASSKLSLEAIVLKNYIGTVWRC